MFNKIIICILFLLINSTLQQTRKELQQYGKITTSSQIVVYMSLDGFKAGDKVYFEGSYSGHEFSEIPLYFKEVDDYTSAMTGYEQVFSNSHSQIGLQLTYYITYTLKGNSKYLLIATPDFHTQGISVTFTLEHTKGSNIGLIILIIVAVIIVAVVVAFIICRCRRKNSY